MHIDTIDINYHPNYCSGCCERLAKNKLGERIYERGVSYNIEVIELLVNFPLIQILDAHSKMNLLYTAPMQLFIVNDVFDYSSFHSLN